MTAESNHAAGDLQQLQSCVETWLEAQSLLLESSLSIRWLSASMVRSHGADFGLTHQHLHNVLLRQKLCALPLQSWHHDAAERGRFFLPCPVSTCPSYQNEVAAASA